MGDFLCKLWRGLLQVFSSVIEASAEALKVVGGAAVDVLSELFQSAGDALGSIFGSSPILWLALAGGAIWFFGGRDKDDERREIDVTPNKSPVLYDNINTKGFNGNGNYYSA